MSPSHGLSRPRLPVPLGTERHADGAGSDAQCSIGPVRRLFTWLAGAAGGVAAYRAIARRKLPPEPVAGDVDPAQELRAKLAEARSEPEPAPEAKPEPPDTPDARRRDVHEQARAALDEMRDKT
jgi:hypothetical protein